MDSALPPQHKKREGETQASSVADTADETKARSKSSWKHCYKGKKMGSTVRTFNHRVYGTMAESGEGTRRRTHSGHPTTSRPCQRPDCAGRIALSTWIPLAISSTRLMGGPITQLHEVKLEDCGSVTVFVDMINTIMDNLATCSKKVDDDNHDLWFDLTNGFLPHGQSPVQCWKGPDRLAQMTSVELSLAWLRRRRKARGRWVLLCMALFIQISSPTLSHQAEPVLRAGHTWDCP